MNTLLMKRLIKFIIPVLFLAALYILIFQAQWLGIIVIKNPLVPLGTLYRGL
jgi:Na+-translocating ferredoxin:NAD+ oxidoreductase RnfD subunit